MQRGLSITLAASVNKATERALSSRIFEKAVGGWSGTTSATAGQTAAAARKATAKPHFDGFIMT
jgi:hypothetical protein